MLRRSCTATAPALVSSFALILALACARRAPAPDARDGSSGVPAPRADGAITIASLMHIRRRGLFVVRALAGFYAAIIAFTFSRNFYLSGLLLAVAGYCMIISVATINSLLQHLAEDHMRGRVMSIYSTAFLGLPPIGCLIAGSLSHLFYAPHVIAGMCSLAIGGSMAVYVNKEGLKELD